MTVNTVPSISVTALTCQREPADLGTLVVLGRNRVEAFVPDGAVPIIEVTDFDGGLLFDAPDELGQVIAVFRRHQQVEVVRGKVKSLTASNAFAQIR